MSKQDFTYTEGSIAAQLMKEESIKPIGPKKPKPPVETLPSLFPDMPPEVAKYFDARKRRFVILYSSGGYSMNEIAKLLGVSPQTATNWLNMTEVQYALSRINEYQMTVVKNRIQHMANKALDTMEELMDSPVEQVRFSASKDVLDRAGHKPAQNIQVNKTVNIEKELANLKESAIEAEYVEDER